MTDAVSSFDETDGTATLAPSAPYRSCDLPSVPPLRSSPYIALRDALREGRTTAELKAMWLALPDLCGAGSQALLVNALLDDDVIARYPPDARCRFALLSGVCDWIDSRGAQTHERLLEALTEALVAVQRSGGSTDLCWRSFDIANSTAAGASSDPLVVSVSTSSSFGLEVETGHNVWSASTCLARWFVEVGLHAVLEQHSSGTEIFTKRSRVARTADSGSGISPRCVVVELGSGTGLCGIGLAKAAAASAKERPATRGSLVATTTMDVHCTDTFAVSHNLRINVAANGFSTSDSGEADLDGVDASRARGREHGVTTCDVGVLDWEILSACGSESESESAGSDDGGDSANVSRTMLDRLPFDCNAVDVVIGSDLLYNQVLHLPLLRVLDRLLWRREEGGLERSDSDDGGDSAIEEESAKELPPICLMMAALRTKETYEDWCSLIGRSFALTSTVIWSHSGGDFSTNDASGVSVATTAGGDKASSSSSTSPAPPPSVACQFAALPRELSDCYDMVLLLIERSTEGRDARETRADATARNAAIQQRRKPQQT